MNTYWTFKILASVCLSCELFMFYLAGANTAKHCWINVILYGILGIFLLMLKEALNDRAEEYYD